MGAAMAELYLAFLAGLLGAGHCLGMCGGIVGACFLGGGTGWRDHAAYHGGRVLAYVLLAALAGALGAALVLTGWFGRGQGLLYVAAGGLLIWVGARALLGFPVFRLRRSKPQVSTLTCAAAHPSTPEGDGLGERGGVAGHPVQCFDRASLAPYRTGYLAAGFVNGVMPCALFFTIALKAAAAAQPLSGAALGLAFGIGTVPAMLAAGILARWLGGQQWPRRIAGLAIALLGIQAVWAGVKFFRVMLHLPLG